MKCCGVVDDAPIILAMDACDTAFSSSARIFSSLPSSFDLPSDPFGVESGWGPNDTLREMSSSRVTGFDA